MKIVVDYDHDSSNLDPIYLAATADQPSDNDWIPALRDIVDGKRVVWVRDSISSDAHKVWLRDAAGVRRVSSRRL